MPQSEELSVRFIGEDGSLKKSLGSLQDQLKRLEKGLKDADNATSFNRIQRAILETRSRIDVLQKSGSQLGQSLGSNLSRGSDQATQSLINLSRVAQDAPYGFIGIANNLNPLLESFQRLQTSTGSTGGALKALGSQLTGAGGIGLAIGVVSSLLVVFGDKLFDSKKKLDENALALLAFANAAKESKERIEDLEQQISSLNKLAAINLKIAFDDKNKVQLFDFQGQSVANREFIAQIEREVESLKKQSSDAFSLFQQKASEEAQQAFSAGQLDAIFDDLKEGDKKLVDGFRNLDKTINEQNKKLEEARNTQSVLYRQIALTRVESEREAAEKLREETEEKNKKRLDQLKKQLEEEKKIFEQRRLEIRQALAQPLKANDFQQELSDQLARSLIQIKPSDELTRFRVPITIIPEIKVDNKSLEEAVKAEFVDKLNTTIENSVKQIHVEAFTGIGESIANALTGANIGDGLKGIFSSIGSIIQQLGTQIIALSPIIAAVKAAIKSFSPAGILAAGVGLVALGSIIKNLTASTGLATGGIIPPGFENDTFPARLSSREAVIPLDNLHKYVNADSGDDVLITRFRGNEMQLMLARNAKRNRRVR